MEHIATNPVAMCSVLYLISLRVVVLLCREALRRGADVKAEIKTTLITLKLRVRTYDSQGQRSETIYDFDALPKEEGFRNGELRASEPGVEATTTDD